MKSLSYKRIYKSQEYLATLGTIEYRSLFGSYSLTVDDTVFAMVSDGELYLRACEQSAQYCVKHPPVWLGHGWRAGRRSAKHWFRRAGVALCDVAANRSGQPGVIDDLNGIVDRAVLAAAGDADVASGAARLSARHRSIVISSMGERCCFIRSRITRICGAE